MQYLPVIIFLISSAFAYDEAFSEEPSDNDKITTRTSYSMVGDISNKGRRYEVDDTTDVIKEFNKEEEINLSTVETEKPPPIPFARNVRSFDYYNDLYDNYRRKNVKENKNNDPKDILNDIRSRNTQSNAYNEDQQRRMFFSHIFSLFDDDRNARSGKSNDKSKHSKSHIDHELDTFKNSNARTELPFVTIKHESHKKVSSKNKNMEPENDSFESVIESYLNAKRLSNNYFVDENEGKHKRKNKGRRQATRNNSRPERQLDDSEIFESVEDQKDDDSFINHEFISNKMIKNRKRKNIYNDEIFNSQNSFNFVTSTSAPEINDERDSSETAYLVRTPSFNYYQTDVTYAIPDDEKQMENEDDKPINDINTSDNNQLEDSHVIEVPDVNNTESRDIKQSFTFIPDIQSTTSDEENTERASQEESVNIPNDSEIIETKPIKVVVEDIQKNESENVSDLKLLNDLVGKNTQRMNHINVDEDIGNEITPSAISTIKEEIETPDENIQVSKVHAEAAIPDVRHPLSARIKLDLLIQLPSPIEVDNDI